ncbi:MAG TPA: acyl-ACP thioesterase domain-containing protein [Candidatus Limnocylindrales bacterium]|nr:acyl-ACP thioesterase domain-containing protein [Candidatus Limnocylindrales bacterium]
MSVPRPDPEVVRGVSVAYRVRFDECAPDGLVRSSALLRYAQDVAWVHSERMGFDRAWYADRDLAWVVRAAELAILEPVALGQTLEVSTAVIGFRKVWARRRTEGRLGDGRLALWGHTDWVMTDVVRGAPGRVPPEFPGAFDVPPGPFDPGRVPLPPSPDGAVRHRSSVRPQDLDPMGHVNNAAYLDYLEEALHAVGAIALPAIAGTPRRVRIEYLAPASPGAGILGEAWQEAQDDRDGWAWRLTDDEGRELARARVTAGA